MLGLVIKKLIRKKPPNIINIATSGKVKPISENDNKNKYILTIVIKIFLILDDFLKGKTIVNVYNIIYN
tara:strand:+ start:639 stop:845 length:207 start_codon:yes stop_codon:yes gene_type:complete